MIDIRNRDMNKAITFKQLWLQEMYKKLRMSPDMDDVSSEDIKKYLLNIYDGRRVVQGRLYNQPTADNTIMSQEDFINIFLNKPYILSGYACLYQNQDNSVNVSSAALENLGEMRKFNKKKMEAAEHGSNDYIYYRILQLTYKVLMNSYYGILGERNSVFYSASVQNSITTTGQDLITTSIIAMESFLSNNVPFNDTDDVITYLSNCSQEKYKFNIMDYLDAPITKDELIDYLMAHKKPEAELDRDIISGIVSKFDAEITSRIYYKNQIPQLIRNSWFVEKLRKMSQYVYAEEPAEEMKADLEDFKEKVIQFCHYDYLYEDRYKRAMKDKRKCIITIDTDLSKIGSLKKKFLIENSVNC